MSSQSIKMTDASAPAVEMPIIKPKESRSLLEMESDPFEVGAVAAAGAGTTSKVHVIYVTI